MDEEWMRRTELELSKFGFLLEALYALRFNDHGAEPIEVDAFSDELCRQALLPATMYGSDQGPEYMRQFQEMLAHRLAMFFSGVRVRVASVQSED